MEDDWEVRLAAQWKRIDAMPPEDFVAAIDALAAERTPGDAAALFERASARDTVGLESGAENFYRAALATGRLDPYRGARATIQLASTLRILGELDESERLLVAELDRRSKTGGDHALHDELRAILALTYVAQGRAVEGAGLALLTLAPHLTRYNRSMAGNAAELIAQAGRSRNG
jgi:Tetratrico peptide repeat